MNRLLLLSIFQMVLYSCERIPSTDALQKSIPGTYIRFSQHEFGIEYDTLVISLQNESANEFKILRKWKYERVLDGQAIGPEYKMFITSGIYENSKGILEETESSAHYSFDRKKGLIFKGTAQYSKIK